jgi:hypothetical protein
MLSAVDVKIRMKALHLPIGFVIASVIIVGYVLFRYVNAVVEDKQK